MLEVLRSGRLSLGPTIDRFEELLAERVGAPYAAAVSSGTTGLHLLCDHGRHRAGRRGDHVAVLVRGDRELLPLRGRTSRLRGHRPADAQSRPGGRRGRGHRADESDRRRRHLRLPVRARRAARDRRQARPRAASTTPARRSAPSTSGAPLGSHGTSGVFAFYPNKQMTTGEGGMVMTHSEEEWHLIRSLRNQGRPDPGGWLEHVRLGFNYRLSDVAAAIGIGQLERLDEILARARAAAEHATTSCWRGSTGSSCRPPTTRTIAAPGSSTSSSCPDTAARERVDRRPSSVRGSATTATSPRSTCSRTCASASASRRGSARSPRTSAHVRSRFRSSRGSRRAAQERVAEVLASAL